MKRRAGRKLQRESGGEGERDSDCAAERGDDGGLRQKFRDDVFRPRAERLLYADLASALADRNEHKRHYHQPRDEQGDPADPADYRGHRVDDSGVFIALAVDIGDGIRLLIARGGVEFFQHRGGDGVRALRFRVYADAVESADARGVAQRGVWQMREGGEALSGQRRDSARSGFRHSHNLQRDILPVYPQHQFVSADVFAAERLRRRVRGKHADPRPLAHLLFGERSAVEHVQFCDPADVGARADKHGVQVGRAQAGIGVADYYRSGSVRDGAHLRQLRFGQRVVLAFDREPAEPEAVYFVDYYLLSRHAYRYHRDDGKNAYRDTDDGESGAEFLSFEVSYICADLIHLL